MNKLEDIKIVAADESALPIITGLLKENDLPTEDIPEKLGGLYLGYNWEEFIGIGGIETFGGYGLLRSLVVIEEFRGEGYGSTLCDLIVKEAAERGVSELYLLTTTAPGFFEKLGFGRIARAEAPEEIKSSTEFSQLCPETAALMRRAV